MLTPPRRTPYTTPVASRPGVHVGVMLDTKGPEIRTGFLGGKKTVEYTKGSTVEVVTDYARPGDESTCVAWWRWRVCCVAGFGVCPTV